MLIFISRKEVEDFYNQEPKLVYFKKDYYENCYFEEEAWENFYDDWCEDHDEDISFKDWEHKMLM